MGRLDRYTGRFILSSYVSALLFVQFVWVVVDVLLNAGRYLEAAEEHQLGALELGWLWLRYQMVSAPWLFVGTAPFVTVISCMFAVARLMNANEIVPMVFTGRPMVRVLLPALAMGVISALAMAFTWEVLVPMLTRQQDELARILNRNDAPGELESVVLFSPDRRSRLMCDNYDPEKLLIVGLVVVHQGNSVEDLSEVTADKAIWDEERADWRLTEGWWRAGVVSKPREWLQMGELTPEMIRLSGREARGSFILSYTDLFKLMQLSPGRQDLVISFNYHLTWPIANLVLLMLALPFAVRFERGSRVGRLALAVAVCGAYLLVDLTFQNLGRREYLHPVVASWIPPIVFGSLGATMFGGMRS